MTLASDPIVIFGAPRSGTTFLNELLNSHPEVHITHEMRLFAWAHETLVEAPKKDRLLVNHREKFVEHATNHFAGMIRDFYTAEWPHVRYWGDKNPHYADMLNRGCLDTVRRIFPGAKFIHIVRDGRDVVASIIRRKHPDGTPWADLKTAAMVWRDHVTIGSAFGKSIGPESYYEIRYEELVADGLRGARGIFGFLGIPLDPAVEQFCLAQQTTRSPLSSPTRNLSASSVFHSDWGQALSEEDQALAMDIIEPKLVEWGYLTGRSHSHHDARPESRAVSDRRARLVALYLPQFHPIPENDVWWGKGFTEWTNVSKARPLFPGHDQPHLPADLGYYDLRVPETRQAQADLARSHGIEAFCYWHFWFEGQRLLERPFDEVLRSGEPDFPFCLAWANETWSRRGLGEESALLRKQTYSAADNQLHARWLIEAFCDRRYLRVNGRPVFLVYRPSSLPDGCAFTDAVRRECERAKLSNPYLLGISSHSGDDYRALGFDGTMEFEPQFGVLANPLGDGVQVHDYTESRRKMLHGKGESPSHPCIMVSWDNTPRCGEHGIAFTGATPRAFEQGLREMIASVQHQPMEERLVFVNAWNDWAEGNHLEPCLRHGIGYLEAVKRANGLGLTDAGMDLKAPVIG